jgi:hypothetical protein
MFSRNWNHIATFLALAARISSSIPKRGVSVIEDDEKEPVAVLVFVNDYYESSARAWVEMAFLRQCLRGLGGEELGFGLSPVGSSWVMLARTTDCRYRTRSGKAFQLEMLKSSLADLVQKAAMNAPEYGQSACSD